MRRVSFGIALALAAMTGPATAQRTPYAPPQHGGLPPLIDALSAEGIAQLADQGTSIERDRPAGWALAEHRRLDAALGALTPQRKGMIDAYVLAVGLDSDPNFGREAREAGRVLSRRYGAVGHTLVLAGTDGTAESALPIGSPEAIGAALARIAELMDVKEDVLILYTTSHGAPFGIVYNDADQGFGAISPTRLRTMLSTLGIRRRVLLISACYAGVFVPMLQSDDTAIITAADADHTSFGCQADADWTFFGDALINIALRKPQPFAAAGAEALKTIGAWERQGDLTPSNPQVSIGRGAKAWLGVLERQLPAESAKVGRPATSLLASLPRH